MKNINNIDEIPILIWTTLWFIFIWIIISTSGCRLAFYREPATLPSGPAYTCCCSSFITRDSALACSACFGYPFDLRCILRSKLSRVHRWVLLCFIILGPLNPSFGQLVLVHHIFAKAISTHPSLQVDYWCTEVFVQVPKLRHTFHQHLR